MSIWDNEQLARFNVLPSTRLTLGEGDTPYFRTIYDGTKVVIKNEMANPTHSFKDRSLAFQLSQYISNGIRRFVISSSGNAAISAANYVAKSDSEIDIFISDMIDEGKEEDLMKMESSRIRIHKGPRPKSDAIKFARDNNSMNLRGSIDDLALTGFKTIAYEVSIETPDIDCLFLPTSSGTSALALHYGFEEMNMKVAIFVCQSQRVHPIAMEFDKDYEEKDSSIADAIVDRVALRKPKLMQVLKKNGGGGYVISDYELFEAQARTGLSGYQMPSFNSALAFAGLRKAMGVEFKFKLPLILVSGI